MSLPEAPWSSVERYPESQTVATVGLRLTSHFLFASVSESPTYKEQKDDGPSTDHCRVPKKQRTLLGADPVPIIKPESDITRSEDVGRRIACRSQLSRLEQRDKTLAANVHLDPIRALAERNE